MFGTCQIESLDSFNLSRSYPFQPSIGVLLTPVVLFTLVKLEGSVKTRLVKPFNTCCVGITILRSTKNP